MPLQNRGYLFNIGLKYDPEKNVGRFSGNFCSFGVVFAGQREKRAYSGKEFKKIVLNQTVESTFRYQNIVLNLRYYSLKPTQCSTSRKRRVKQGRGGEVLQKGIDRELNLRV